MNIFFWILAIIWIRCYVFIFRLHFWLRWKVKVLPASSCSQDLLPVQLLSAWTCYSCCRTEHPAGWDPQEGCHCGLWSEQLLECQLKTVQVSNVFVLSPAPDPGPGCEERRRDGGLLHCDWQHCLSSVLTPSQLTPFCFAEKSPWARHCVSETPTKTFIYIAFVSPVKVRDLHILLVTYLEV